jgi:hypothetical protein
MTPVPPKAPWSTLEWIEWLLVLAAVVFAIAFGLLF